MEEVSGAEAGTLEKFSPFGFAGFWTHTDWEGGEELPCAEIKSQKNILPISPPPLPLLL